MANSGNTGLRRLIMACKFSKQGFLAAYQYEEAFRQEVWVLVAAIPLAFWLGDSGVEIILLIGSVLLLMVIELLNSAVEAVVDRIGIEKHELSGRAKDMGSAAVLTGIILVVLTWATLLLT